MKELNNLFKAAEQEYDALKSKGLEHKKLSFEVQMAQRQYEDLDARRSQAKMEGKVEYSYAQQWEKAELPRKPYWPNWPIGLALGVFAGLVLAALGVLTLELADDTIRTTRQLRDELGVEALGAVPFVNRRLAGRLNHLAREYPRSLPVESLRRLRTGLSLSYGPQGGVLERRGAIMVTSANENEGKSFVSSNLAYLLAQAGHQVLLVDMDLYKRDLTRAFDLLSAEGLSSLARGAGALLSCAQNGVHPNLHVLASGPQTDQPSGVIESPDFPVFLDEARKGFDFVILDAPPILSVADACTLAARVDAVLVVARSRSTRRGHVDQVQEILRRARAAEIHWVVNAVRPADMEASGYGYGYKGGEKGYGAKA